MQQLDSCITNLLIESDDDPTTTLADTGMGEGSGMFIIIIICNPIST